MRKCNWVKQTARLGIFGITALLACAAPSWSGEKMAEPEKIRHRLLRATLTTMATRSFTRSS